MPLVGILYVASQTDYLMSQHNYIPVIYLEVQVDWWELYGIKSPQQPNGFGCSDWSKHPHENDPDYHSIHGTGHLSLSS